MDKLLGKLVLLILILGIGVFYGVSLSKNGIEQIHGPLSNEPAETFETEPVAPDTQPQQSDDATEPAAAASAPVAAQDGEPLVMQLINKIGGLLRLLADGLIRLLVGFGEAVLS